jgi:8-oxo-dGTP pyrophosphatase MutT (NUDIX family)
MRKIGLRDTMDMEAVCLGFSDAAGLRILHPQSRRNRPDAKGRPAMKHSWSFPAGEGHIDLLK